MIIKLILLLISSYFLVAYELPKVELSKTNKPEIILFSAESLLVDGKKSYKIKWKTINADSVMITFLGKVDVSGSVIVTENEYNRGAITLTASSNTTSVVDNQTINKQKNVEAPVVIFKDTPDDDRGYYNTMPYRRPYRRPLHRRRAY